MVTWQRLLFMLTVSALMNAMLPDAWGVGLDQMSEASSGSLAGDDYPTGQGARSDPDLALGLGAARAPDYLGSDNYRYTVVPYFKATWATRQYIRLQGTTLDSNLLADPVWRLGPVVQYRRAPFENAHNATVRKLHTEGSAIGLGGALGAQFTAWDLRLQLVKDISGDEGWLTTLQGGYTFTLRPDLKLRLGATTTYGSKDYMMSYFGIDSDNAERSDLKEYHADASFRDVGTNLKLDYDLTRNWSISAIAAYARLVGDAHDSPVVADKGSPNQFFGALLGIYHF